MAAGAPPPQFAHSSEIPIKTGHIRNQDGTPIEPDSAPIQTNKFYTNFFLGAQNTSVWTTPYSLTWANGINNTYGMAVRHIERDQLAQDGNLTDPITDAPVTIRGPLEIQNIVLSATELQNGTFLYMTEVKAFSAVANLAPSSNNLQPVISFPLVQGMGFVTGIYNDGTPHLSSPLSFLAMNPTGGPEQLENNVYKYRLTLGDNTTWLVYVRPSVDTLDAPLFVMNENNTVIEGPAGFSGTIQIAKNPLGETGEIAYDSTAGAYAVNAAIYATTIGSVGSYSLSWGKGGVEKPLIMFALPHQLESMDEATMSSLTDIVLATVTKGFAKAFIADSITLREPALPNNIGFEPWIVDESGTSGHSSIQISENARSAALQAARIELERVFDQRTTGSDNFIQNIYWRGKALSRFAIALYTTQEIVNDTQLAAEGLLRLKEAFDIQVRNIQDPWMARPLVYDTVWKGIISPALLGQPVDSLDRFPPPPTVDLGLQQWDYGNTVYNDHHFHYGYLVYTAAVIGYLDPTWLTPANIEWVNALIRDFANPSETDPYFPFQRNFDWWSGHSWAGGLQTNQDGRNEESSSEDAFATYGLKMWGKVSGDANMEARANLQLAVQKRAFSKYFLLTANNTVQPDSFLPNKVVGILFDNLITHSTYFGNTTLEIEGIQMLPINPSSAYTRPKDFVREEWDTYFEGGEGFNVNQSNSRERTVPPAWTPVVYSNLALIEPSEAFNFFQNLTGFLDDTGNGIDAGLSVTWFLAYSSALSGATV